MTFGTTIGSGGLRFYDANHVVSYNYVQGVAGGPFQGPLEIDAGDVEGTSTTLDAHWRVVNALVERNVLVADPEGIRIGDNFSLAPTGCIVRDNIVAQATSGTAVTQVKAPVSTTLTNNTYSSTPSGAGLTADSTGIYRASGYGPRLTYLQVTDVGITGDLSDADGTGVLISGGSIPPPPGSTDPTTAAGLYGWGAPNGQSDEFAYTGAPDPTKWNVYSGTGNGGNGVRDPQRVTVAGGVMTLTGLAGSANTAGMEHRFDQQYGRWEVRFRSYYTNSPTSTGLSGGYHPVLIVWPTSDKFPDDGEYDFAENGEPAEQAADGFMHFPSLDGQTHQIELPRTPVDLRNFHNFAFEWTPDHVAGWIDGQPWFSYSGGAASDRKKIQDMPSGHLTIQLDADAPSGMLASTMEVDWARVYTLTPSSPPAGSQTLTVPGISTRQAFGFPIVSGGESSPPPGSTPTLLGSAILGTAMLGYTTSGSVPPGPSGSQTVAGVGNIFSAQALGLPTVRSDDGPFILNAIGVSTAFTAGVPKVSTGAPPSPAPGGVLVPALFAVGADGTTLTPLPSWSKITVSPVRNSAGAITVEYPAGGIGFDVLNDGVSATPLHVQEIRLWLGGNATGALGGWLVAKSGDSLSPDSTWTFSGHFHEWLLKKAIVAPQPITTVNDKAELRFAGASAGLILATLMDQAQARGALPLVARDFTSQKDSNGQPWANVISSFNLAPKTKIQEAADKLVDLGMVEYEMTSGRVWRAFNAGTRGVDRTTGSNPLTFAQAANLAEHSRRETIEDAGTAVLAAGSQGFYEWADSPTARAELGWRAEVGYDVGQISSEAGVQAAAGTQLDIARHGVAEYDAAIEFTLGNPLPLIDYGIGDWAYVVAGDTRTRLRIAQLGVTFQPGRAPSGTVSLNDLVTDKLTALYRRLNALQTGDGVVGTSEPTPGGTGQDLNPPAAPQGVVVSSTIAYRVPAEDTILALVSVGWAAVTNNAYADDATAAKSKLATIYAARNRQLGIGADWTVIADGGIEQTYGPTLIEEWKADPTNTDNSTLVSAALLAWLDAYPTKHLGGGAIADDIDHYVVQYSYIGGSVVGISQPSPDWVAPRDPNDPTGFGVDYSWREPDESPTNNLSITFGDVTAARAIGIRVAAVDRTGNQGPWSAVVGVVTAADDTPPPIPSKPIAAVWFETMDITWDGKGSAGEDMRVAAPDLDFVEVHVGTGIAFVPDRPIGPDGKVNYAASQTFKSMLYTAGTWNVTDLTVGITYFARLVAVDRSGNASDPSETSNGALPQQLVQIDIGPNAIGREQIIDLEVVTGKIANLAVNDAKISDLSVGKLTAGTMTANVVLGGRFITPSSNNNHIEIDSAGIRLYQGNSVVGHWQVFDASMLMTGQAQTAITGQRIVMNPGGNNPDTIRFYPTFSDIYSSIDSVSYGGGTIAGIRIVGSANTTSGHRGMLVIRDQYSSIVNALPDLSDWGSEMYVEEHFTRNRSAAVDLVIDERLTAVGGPPRVAMIYYDVNGSPINATGLYYKKTDFNGGEPQFYANGQDCALVFAPDGLKIRNNPNGDWRDIWYATAHVMSGRDTKANIRGLDIDTTALLRDVKPKRFHRRHDEDDAPDRMGFIAEDMPYPVRVTSVVPPTDPDQPPRIDEAIDYSAVTALLWAATQQIEGRVTALEEGRNE